MQQRKWKRKLSGLMAGVMLLGTLPTAAFAWDAPTDGSWDAATEDVAARFFVGSDTHIGRDANAAKKLENALNVFHELDPATDGVLLAGDITNTGSEGEYAALMDIINDSALNDKVVLAMGNHEYGSGTMARFEEKTGQEANEVLYYNADGLIPEEEEIGGDLVATVIKLSAKNYGGDYTDNYEMMKTALEKSDTANEKAPVIVIGHHGIKSTAYVTEEWYGNYGKGTEKDMVALMEQYPQVIHFSGHSHATLEDARSIYQDDGYTAIQDSTIGAYFENESGKVDPDSGKSSTYPANREISSQALRVDVLEDGTVKIYRMNLTTGEYIYEPWVFNAANNDMPYTNDRMEKSDAPSFNEDAAVTVESVTKNSVVVKFPAAQPASDGNLDMIHEYVISLTPEAGGDTIVRKVFADYYEQEQKAEWSVKLINLNPETTYSVSVTAVTSFDAKSEPIVSEETFTTGQAYVAPYPAEAILDVDFSRNDSGADAENHTKKVYGEPQFIQDETLGRTVAVFDGSDDGLRYAMKAEDYEKIGKNFTVELYYMPLDTKNNNPMGNTQSSGFCFEQVSGTNTLQFWAHIGGNYQKPETTVAKDAWNHMVATYDGQNVKLYLNGELKNTVSAPGTMTEPPHYLFLGGDTSSDGDLEYQANCKIALARVYTGTMTADDAKEAYKAAKEGTVTEPEDPSKIPSADILNVDFSTGSEADLSENKLAAVKRGDGSITYVYDKVLGKKVANFDGSSAYSYPMSGQYSKLDNTMTFEVTYNYNVLSDSGEYDLLSNQQSGGFGLGTDSGNLKFFCHVDGSYKTPSTTATPAEAWHHLVGVFDGSKVKLYLDGALKSEVVASGKIGLPGSNADEVFIGGDSGADNELQFPSDVKIATARIYSAALSEEQIAALAKSELPKGDVTAPVMTFASTPAASGKIGEVYSVPAMSIQDDSAYTVTVRVDMPSSSAELNEEQVKALLAGYEYTPTEAGTYKITYTAVDAVGNKAEKSFTVKVIDPNAPVTLPKADMLDVDFADGTAADQSETKNVLKTIGSPVIKDSNEMGKRIASFNGSYDAYLYPFGSSKYDRMKVATIESVFCYDEIPSGEHDMFSNQQGGGIGLGLENGRLQFFCNVNKNGGGNGYVQPNAAIEAGKWYHAVGVFDGENVKLYLNGELIDSKSAGGSTIHWTTSENAQNFLIGADSNDSGGAESYSKGSVSIARLYSQSMTDEQVKKLYESLDPVLLSVSGATGRMQINQETDVSVVKGSNGKTAVLKDITVNGVSVLDTEYNAEKGKITPTQLGDYIFTYTLGSQTKNIVRACVADASAKINLGVVSVDQMAAGIQYNVAVHVNLGEDAEATSVAFDLNYDADKLDYTGCENASDGVVTKTEEGTLHFAKSGLSSQEFKNFSETRVAKLSFRVKDDVEEGTSEFHITNVTAQNGGAAAEVKPAILNKNVKVLAQNTLDKNGDGVIGAGDVALAGSIDEAKTIAMAAAIYPYKHVIMITMDGGGICFRPDAMYYVQNGEATLTNDETILAKRTNDYAMRLFNEYFATSYSAKSETPTISAQNYTAILHGKEYATAQDEYKITNNEAGSVYYPDFGKETAVYPSAFQVLGKAFPQRGNAAFAEWTPIINGIIEPDAPVYTHSSTKDTGNLQDVADYIKSDAFQNTAMVYMQSDYMDGVGHGNGYFTDKYYAELPKFDAYFEAVMKALEETGTKDETLVLVNSDHGGTAGGSHGGTSDAEYDVQIGLGGQTIDNGKKLTGGTNHDPAVLALTALRANIPASMDGSASLFEQANLSQEQLVKKNRDIETVTAYTGPNTKTMELKLSNVKENVIKAADLVIDLNGRTVSDITTSGTILRQTVEGGKLYLTISCTAANGTLAKIVFDGASDGVKVEEFMLGTDSGKEIYGDLLTETVDTIDPSEPSRPDEGGSSSGSNSSRDYLVTVEKTVHGVVTTSSKRAEKDDTVTIIVKPDAGYELEKLTVTDKDGDVIRVKDQGNEKYTFTMPSGKVSINAAFVRAAQNEGTSFVDVKESDYFYDAVLWAVGDGITSGTSATTFAPNATCTRAQMATFLWRYAGSPAPKSTAMPFHDIPADAYYNTAVQWAVEQGITSGTSDTTFSPDAVMTRAQTVTLLWRFAGSPDDVSGNSFADVAENAYYAKAVQWAAKEGITSGTSTTTFGPDAGCTRAQIVTFLWRYMSK